MAAEPAHAPLTLIGAGLVGTLLAALLARRGFVVDVFERGPDPRVRGLAGGRSINLALTERGWHVLRVAGLEQATRKVSIPMRGRMIHGIDGSTNFQRYGKDDDSEANWSIGRSDLNRILVDGAISAGANIHFNHRLESVDWERDQAHFQLADGSRRTHHAPVLIGADGVASTLRAAMLQVADLGEQMELLQHGYKELEIPPLARFPSDWPAPPDPGHGRYAIDPHALHIWPRGGYMCIALPNTDGNFTVTLFLPKEGEPSFDSIRTGAQARAFFAREFADASALIPALERNFDERPTGMLGTLYLRQWHLGARAVLLGDAAHAVVPFHGQGANAGFEDALALSTWMARHGDDLNAAFSGFAGERKPQADAIARMSLDNYIEMRDSVADPDYIRSRQLDRVMAERFPERWLPRYAMITFTRIPYAVALERCRTQTALRREILQGHDGPVEQIDLAQFDARVHASLEPLADIKSP